MMTDAHGESSRTAVRLLAFSLLALLPACGGDATAPPQPPAPGMTFRGVVLTEVTSGGVAVTLSGDSSTGTMAATGAVHTTAGDTIALTGSALFQGGLIAGVTLSGSGVVVNLALSSSPTPANTQLEGTVTGLGSYPLVAAFRDTARTFWCGGFATLDPNLTGQFAGMEVPGLAAGAIAGVIPSSNGNAFLVTGSWLQGILQLEGFAQDFLTTITGTTNGNSLTATWAMVQQSTGDTINGGTLSGAYCP